MRFFLLVIGLGQSRLALHDWPPAQDTALRYSREEANDIRLVVLTAFAIASFPSFVKTQLFCLSLAVIVTGNYHQLSATITGGGGGGKKRGGECPRGVD